MLFAIVLLALLAPAASGADDLSRFLGKWRGDSSCVARNTACHDETVIYRLANLPNKPGYVLVSADKIVNGNAINMGTLEFRHDQTQQMLVCECSQGVWRFKRNGGRMEGKLTLQDGTEFRRVTLQREP